MASQAHQAILKQTILETVADELIASIKLFMPLIKPIVRPALLLRAWPHIPTAHWCGTSVHWAPATQSSLSTIHPIPAVVVLPQAYRKRTVRTLACPAWLSTSDDGWGADFAISPSGSRPTLVEIVDDESMCAAPARMGYANVGVIVRQIGVFVRDRFGS